MLQATIGELAHAHFRVLPEIVFINILLSGDNAVIIAMACRGLPGKQRILGLAIGEGVSVALLIAFAGVMARLLQWPYLKLAGGIALVYIAVRLTLPQRREQQVESTTDLWRAVRIVAAADLVMSFDNVLAIVQIARGNVALLAIGLAVSIPIIVAGAALIARLLDRWPVLIWAGAVLLGWVAGQTIVGDQAIAGFVTRAFGDSFIGGVGLAAGCAGAVAVVAAGCLWRRRQASSGRS